ncbi:MAG: response regulator transcription factor [Acidiferrobacterales bacterium]|nr:response regulator transcription factor [Acidiferrobacterales bacterium]
MRIALLEDDKDQAALVNLWLEGAGHEVKIYPTGREFQKAVARDSYDLLVLDWILPDINGDEVLKWVRETVDWPIPVLFMTQRDAEEDVVHILELGADDYMSKPVSQAVLIARINALGRRARPRNENEQTTDYGAYNLDPKTHTVSVNGEAIELTSREFDLAWFLFRNSGRVLSRGHILEAVWGSSPDLNTRTVDTHISRLRKKLNISEENGWRLKAIYQHGYRLESLNS